MTWLSVPDDMIVISKKEYDQLIEDSEFLANLHAAGVDNWDGYHYGFNLEDD